MKRIMSAALVLLLLLGTAVLPTPVQAAATIQAGTVKVSSGWLNVRKSPSTASAVVNALPNGSYVTLLQSVGDWYQVSYGKGLTGYCHKNYIQTIAATAATVNISAGSLNVRRGAGISHAVIGWLSKGEQVLVLWESGGWSRILYQGTKLGYASSRYLSTGASTYPAVALTVPSYKQTDSRWAHVTLGSSGKTMARIGCATTAIAMMESYRTGTTLYPHTMASRLRYTDTGNVYWPSHYKVTLSSNGYLQAIYQQLSAGKPVLFGAKNDYGSQHWVVITGFTGGNTLTTPGFTIHDPGSNIRTTLEQFLKDYPTFYKYFCY